MDEQVERLRVMLGEADVWDEPEITTPNEAIMMPTHSPHMNTGYFTDSEDDENVLSLEHINGGQLQQAVGPVEFSSEIPTLQSFDLLIGEKAPSNEQFCPLLAIAKYPDQYISAVARHSIKKNFFDAGKLYERVWDFFYIWPPKPLKQKPLVLVPVSQVKHFLIAINNQCRTQLKIPENSTSIGFVVDFPDDGTPRPRYLGKADERELAEYIKQAIPAASFRPAGEIAETVMPTKESIEDFQRRIELLSKNEWQKKASSKEKRRTNRIAKQQSWNHSVKRVQCYLGIRGRASHDEPRDPWNKLNSTSSAQLNLENAAPFAQEDAVIFICVDVESYERDHNMVTEIGIATLDTLDIAHLAPGKSGLNWYRAIRARHFRLKEYGHLRNTEFVHGCAEYFQFGNSEWISVKNAPHEISKCFKEPYSKHSINSQEEAIGKLASLNDDHPLLPSSPKRKIVLVGHDITADINYLRHLGYDPHNLSNLQELVDTASMYRSFRAEANPRNLGSILADLDITSWYLHNAGNDAVYTLHAMIGIAIEATLQEQKRPIPEQLTNLRTQDLTCLTARQFNEVTTNAWDARRSWSLGSGINCKCAPIIPVLQAAQKADPSETILDMN